MSLINFAKRIKLLDENIVDLVLQKASSDPNIISLSGGTPPFPIPNQIWDSLLTKAKDHSKYSQYSHNVLGDPDLRKLVASDLTKELGYSVDPEEILITVGSSSALFSCFLTFINPGDEVLFLSPGYPGNIAQIILAGGKVRYVRLNEKNNWDMDLNSVKRAITGRTKLIMFSEPSNPTGRIYSLNSKQQLLEIAKKNNLIVVSDETYRRLVYDDIIFKSVMSLKNAMQTSILIRSFSKDFSMSGFRLGYIYAKKEFIRRFEAVHIAMNICAPTISQELAKLMFLQKECVYKKYVEEYDKRRKTMCKRLDRLNKFFSYVKPMGGFSMFIKYHKKMTSMDFFEYLLNNAKVAVMPGAAFGAGVEAHFRITFAVSIEKINGAFDRLEKLKNLA